MRAMWNNLWDNGTLTVSSENANLPSTNTQDTRLTSVWRASSTKAQNVIMDAGEEIVANTVGLAGFSFSTGVTVTLTASSSSGFSSTPISETITYRDDIMLKFFSSGEYQYWRVAIDDSASGSMTHDLGRIFLGPYTQFDPSSLIEFDLNLLNTDKTSFSIGNQAYSDIGVNYQTFGYDFPVSLTTMKEQVQSMFESIGNHKPLIFTNYDTDYTVFPPTYVVITNKPRFRWLGNGRWRYSLQFREVN